jgi:hypothetical protein
LFTLERRRFALEMLLTLEMMMWYVFDEWSGQKLTQDGVVEC